MKKHFSKLTILIFGAAMFLSLASCSADTPNEDTLQEPEVPNEERLEAPNGENVQRTENYGVPTFQYASTTIPEGLGLPKLTDAEIDALLAENDPHKVKDAISTLADFVNYCYRGNFVFGDGLIFFFDENGSGKLTTSSGYQTLQRRIGQCASMSSCIHYVLDDDYDEVGYVDVNEHTMAYILCDGLYYLVNPVEYVYTNSRWPTRWLEYLPNDEVVYCSPDFQDIADSIYGKEIGVPITFVYTCAGPGDFTYQGNAEFPIGTTATCWYGEPVSYFLFDDYDWLSQENIVDEKAIVMYPPEENARITFNGIHEDPLTGDLTTNTPEDTPEFISKENSTVIEYLKKIGAITFTNEELAALAETGDLEEICRVITTAEDCTQFIAASGIKEGDNGSIKSAFAKQLLYPNKIMELACRMLDGDYEELGMITTQPDQYYFLYVKQNGKYGIYDVLKATHTGQGEYGTAFDSSEEMVGYAIANRGDDSATMKTWPW